MKKTWLVLAMLLLPVATQAQVRVICQTPNFWCAFFPPQVLPNGTPCHCGTTIGPVLGYSIIDTGFPQRPQYPAPQRQQSRPQPNPAPRPLPSPTADDCYRGLGNCGGAYSH